jgi:hypothetical protein
MSEYIEIDAEATEDPHCMRLVTNVKLASARQLIEHYRSTIEMEEGSPLAQTLAYVEGIDELTIDEETMIIVRRPDMPWHVIIADVSAAVKEFFL